MPRATCRCGQVLSFPADGPDRVVCPTCEARIRVRRSRPEAGDDSDDEPRYLRFLCTCGRRLKVRDAVPRPQAGKCPDCGQVVPVPESLLASDAGGRNGVSGDPETPTRELLAVDAERIARWAARFQPAGSARPSGHSSSTSDALRAIPAPGAPEGGSTVSASGVSPSPGQYEAGLRICPCCGKPVHLNSETCRQCGANVPRR